MKNIRLSTIVILMFLTFNLFGQETFDINEVINFNNQLRKSKNYNPLQSDSILDKMAYLHAYEMATKSFFAHQNPHNPSLATLKKRAEYLNFNYTVIAENIAYFSGNVNDLKQPLGHLFFNQWKKSKPHYKNMMIKEATRVGLSCVKIDKNGVSYYYAVQVIGNL